MRTWHNYGGKVLEFMEHDNSGGNETHTTSASTKKLVVDQFFYNQGKFPVYIDDFG